jgi:hypothetical protein
LTTRTVELDPRHRFVARGLLLKAALSHRP